MLTRQREGARPRGAHPRADLAQRARRSRLGLSPREPHAARQALPRPRAPGRARRRVRRVGRAARRARSTSRPDLGSFVGRQDHRRRRCTPSRPTCAPRLLADARATRWTRRDPRRPSPPRSSRAVRDARRRPPRRASGCQPRRRRPRTAASSSRPFLDWTDVDLRPSSSRRELGVPVVVENDLVALAEAERWFGRGRGHPRLLGHHDRRRRRLRARRARRGRALARGGRRPRRAHPARRHRAASATRVIAAAPRRC